MGNDYTRVKRKKYDAIIGSMTATEDRSKQVDFSDPYYTSGAQVFVAEGNNELKAKADLKDKTIGVMQASTYTDDAKNIRLKLRTFQVIYMHCKIYRQVV